jgi:hypothetical protein
MALIEYVAKKGKRGTVMQPVILKLDSGDRIRFRAADKKTQLVLDDPNGFLTFLVTQPLGHPVGQATTKGNTLIVGVQGDKVKNPAAVTPGKALGGGLGDDTGGGLGDDTGGGLGDDTGGGVGDDVGGGGPPEIMQAQKRKTKRRMKKGA